MFLCTIQARKTLKVVDLRGGRATESTKGITDCLPEGTQGLLVNLVLLALSLEPEGMHGLGVCAQKGTSVSINRLSKCGMPGGIIRVTHLEANGVSDLPCPLLSCHLSDGGVHFNMTFQQVHRFLALRLHNCCISRREFNR